MLNNSSELEFWWESHIYRKLALASFSLWVIASLLPVHEFLDQSISSKQLTLCVISVAIFAVGLLLLIKSFQKKTSFFLTFLLCLWPLIHLAMWQHPSTLLRAIIIFSWSVPLYWTALVPPKVFSRAVEHAWDDIRFELDRRFSEDFFLNKK